MQNQQQANPQQQNAIARSLVVNQSIERVQNIFSTTVDPRNQPVVNVNPRNVGLIKGFFVVVEGTINNGSASPYTIAKFGPSNILSQIKFDDLQNNTRIQTTGWHLHSVNTARNARPFGLAEVLDTSPIAYGNNYGVITAPASVAAAATATVRMVYYVPLAYSNSDLRGALYANVVNATAQLQLTLNASPVTSGTGTNPFNTGVFNSALPAPLAAFTSAKITVYQHYLDQLPMSQQGPILPMLDLSTIYELKNTSVTGISANQDYTVPYANFRTFLSTCAIYDNGNVDPTNANDISWFALRSANFTDIFKYTPQENALITRTQIGIDYPESLYYFNHRDRPINTIQYGNMELVFNCSNVSPNARILVGYENFAMINQVSGAGSLPAGG